MTPPPYDDTFFSYTDRAAVRSAEALLPIVINFVSPQSVLDVGCGTGGWLMIWKQLGISEVCGVDGDYVSRSSLMIDSGEFVPADLSQPLDLHRRFDLAQSLEVAEHLPAAAAGEFVRTLTRHARVILFSAATPGQGGMNHVNERPFEYWRDLFGECGFSLFDAVRPHITRLSSIQPWYRYNTFLYAEDDALAHLGDEMLQYQVKARDSIARVAPWTYRARCATLRPLPVSAVNAICRAKMLASQLVHK